MSNRLPKDCEVVIWAYTVETLSLREALPEKQSLIRGLATWASVMGNKRGRKVKRRRNGEDIGEGRREGSSKLCR